MVVIDPVARRTDGESVRIAKDVLCAGARAKICLADSAEEFARALARRGRRRLVVLGDDLALVRAVGLLHRERGPAEEDALALVPIGSEVSLAGALGVPEGPVAAARAVLDGTVRRMDLLTDDRGGVVLGGVRVPAPPPVPPTVPLHGGGGGPSVWSASWSACRSLVRTLVRPAPEPALRTHRLRVEADGVLLSDLDEPVEGVLVRAGAGGLAEVEVGPGAAGGPPVTAHARTVTVSGPDFRYRADAALGGPVRTRTWTAREGAWGLVLPEGR
ncbi:diacylglycerol kinase family protein [Streptomyces sp. NPDC004111]|uniref:diacylglycerol kinase family protein n=1 Tax=Streptomyces sp. NPDC004111 TaxID=3364690 RepID=UPI0036B5D5B8